VRDPAIASLATPLGDWQLAYDPLGRPVRERDPFGVERRTTYTLEGFVDRVELHSATALVESYATTRTFYKPDLKLHGYPNLEYWNAQPGVTPWTP
jgi:YD repeat-containing protein